MSTLLVWTFVPKCQRWRFLCSDRLELASYITLIKSSCIKENSEELIASSKEVCSVTERGATCWADVFFWWRSCSRPLCCGLQTQHQTPRGQGTAPAQSQSDTWGETLWLSSCKQEIPMFSVAEKSCVWQVLLETCLKIWKTRDHTVHCGQRGLLSGNGWLPGKELLPAPHLWRLAVPAVYQLTAKEYWIHINTVHNKIILTCKTEEGEKCLYWISFCLFEISLAGWL